MFLDTIHGLIDRRVLLNYRLDPDALRRVLPPPFQPKLYDGYGVGGVCMIRFKELRPRFVPSWLGLGSENAAHRIAVEWQQDGEQREGVFIPRRDTNSWFNKTFGGRVFPGIFQRSRFEARETESSVSLRIIRDDGGCEIAFAGHLADQLPETSIFPTLEAAAGFLLPGRYRLLRDLLGRALSRDGAPLPQLDRRAARHRRGTVMLLRRPAAVSIRHDRIGLRVTHARH